MFQHPYDCLHGRKILILDDQYDVVLVDYKMPQTSEITVTEEIRKRGITTPVIIATGSPDERLKNFCNQMQIALLVKPCSLQSTIEKIIESLHFSR